jgi:hypothetical protein
MTITADKTEQYEFEVNGHPLKATEERVPAREILELAAKAGAIPGNPQDYQLKSLILDDRVYGPNEEVDLSKDNQFITLPTTPTTVT